MRPDYYRTNMNKLRSCIVLSVSLIVAYTSYFTEAKALPTESTSDSWPSFPRRNVAALARDGYLKSIVNGYKRSISTLAKNGMLPTYRAPYSDTDKQEPDNEESQEKRNLASIARLRSYSAMKRNIQALARDGFRFGRTQYNQPNEKRNIAALARNGLIHKRDELSGDEYFYPFYQNSVPPLAEINGPYDYNELYDYQQSINPDIYPPLQQVFKRSDAGSEFIDYRSDDDPNLYLKRGIVGMPVHGLYRPMFIDATGSPRSKRSIFSIPDVIDRNDITPDDYESNDDKRSVGSIPLTRISGLGNISLIPKLAHSSIQTTPTYRRRQYLLTRTRPDGTSTDR